MANVQIEHGFTRLANELLEALAGARLPGAHLAVALVVARRTYGWRETVATISAGEVVDATGRDRRTIRRALSDLVSWGVLARLERPGRAARVSIVKDYDRWTVGSTSNAQAIRARGEGVDAPPVDHAQGGRVSTPRAPILRGKETQKERPSVRSDSVVRREIAAGWVPMREAFAAYGAKVPRNLTAPRSRMLQDVARDHPEIPAAEIGARLVHGYIARHEDHGPRFDPVSQLRVPTLCGDARDEYLEAFEIAIAAGRSAPFVKATPLPPLALRTFEVHSNPDLAELPSTRELAEIAAVRDWRASRGIPLWEVTAAQRLEAFVEAGLADPIVAAAS